MLIQKSNSCAYTAREAAKEDRHYCRLVEVTNRINKREVETNGKHLLLVIA